MDYKKNLKDYSQSRLLVSIVMLYIFFIGNYFINKNTLIESVKLSIVFSILFFLLTTIFIKLSGISTSFKSLRYKRISFLLIIVFIIISIILFI